MLRIIVSIAKSVLLMQCKRCMMKKEETAPPPSIIGEWETVSHLIYLPDTTRESNAVYDWLFRGG